MFSPLPRSVECEYYEVLSKGGILPLSACCHKVWKQCHEKCSEPIMYNISQFLCGKYFFTSWTNVIRVCWCHRDVCSVCKVVWADGVKARVQDSDKQACRSEYTV